MSQTRVWYVLKKSPLHNIGVFARDDIPSGTRILAESPVFINRVANEYADLETNRLYKELSRGQKDRYNNLRHSESAQKLEQYEDELTTANNSLNPASIILPYLRSREGANRVAIFRNNCFPIGNLQGQDCQAIFFTAARFNHSCEPNCFVSWNESLNNGNGQLCVHAIRNISNEEELLITYDSDKITVENRESRNNKLLTTWNFTCACPACNVDGPIEDTKREKLARLADQVDEQSQSDPTEKSCIPAIKEVLALMQELGLETWAKAKVHIVLAEMYESNDHVDLAIAERENAVKVTQLCMGDDNQYTQYCRASLEQAKRDKLRSMWN